MAQINPNALDGMEGVLTPDQVQQQQDAQFNRGMAGTSAQQIFAGASRLGRTMFGNPQMEQAQDMQRSIGGAIQNSDEQAPEEEDGLDASIRRLKATYMAVAPLNPQAAMQISNKLGLLQQAQTQQSKLNAQTDLEISRARKEDAAATLDLQNKGTLVIGNPITGKQYGSVRTVDDQGNPDPNYMQKVQQAIQASGDGQAQAVRQDAWTAGRMQAAQIAAWSRQQIADQKEAAKNGLTPDDTANLAAQHAIFGDSVLTRRSQEERDAVTHFETVNNITPFDMVAARGQLKALYANANAQGRREGNVDYLAQSVPALGNNLLDAMNGVTRTNYTGLNTLIRLGKTQGISDPGEQKYSAALQSFVSEYARVINGGTGQSTDSAKEEAWQIIGRDSSPAAIRAAVTFLSQKETQALKGATPLALEALAHPEQYKAIMKIQNKAHILQSAEGGNPTMVGADPNAQQQPQGFAQPAGQVGGQQVQLNPGAPTGATPLGNRIDAIIARGRQ